MARKKLHPFLVVDLDWVSYRYSPEAYTLYQEEHTQARERFGSFGANVEGLHQAREAFKMHWKLPVEEGGPTKSTYAFPLYKMRQLDATYQVPASAVWDEQLLFRIQHGGDGHTSEINTPSIGYIYSLLNYHFEQQASDNLKDRFVQYVHRLVQEHLNEHLAQLRPFAEYEDSTPWLLAAKAWDPRKSPLRAAALTDEKLAMPTTKQVLLLLTFLKDEHLLGKLTQDELIQLVAVITAGQPESMRRYINARQPSSQHFLYTEANVDWAIEALEVVGLGSIENIQVLKSKRKV